MCGVDGMVFDDGTVDAPGRRPLPDDHHHRRRRHGAGLDGGVAADRVAGPAASACTSVTEQWATIAVVGPTLARRAGADLRPTSTSRNEAFPFMTWRDATRRRRARRGSAGSASPASWPTRSTSPPGTGWPSWEALWRGRRRVRHHRRTAPRPCTCCAPRRATRSSARTPTAPSPRRTWAWPGSSRRRSDFIGKRSFSRADTARPTASSSSACCRWTRPCCCPRARSSSQGTRRCHRRRCRCSGHVTSSYRSAALGRTFALALMHDGRDRIGQTLYVPVGRRAGAGDGHRHRPLRPGGQPPSMAETMTRSRRVSPLASATSRCRGAAGRGAGVAASSHCWCSSTCASTRTGRPALPWPSVLGVPCPSRPARR